MKDNHDTDGPERCGDEKYGPRKMALKKIDMKNAV